MDYKQYILELLAPMGEELKLDDPYPTLLERLNKCNRRCTEKMTKEQQQNVNTIMKVINVMSDHYSINNLAIAVKLMTQALQN